jgi:hypothetical protein
VEREAWMSTLGGMRVKRYYRAKRNILLLLFVRLRMYVSLSVAGALFLLPVFFRS